MGCSGGPNGAGIRLDRRSSLVLRVALVADGAGYAKARLHSLASSRGVHRDVIAYQHGSMTEFVCLLITWSAGSDTRGRDADASVVWT